MGLQTWEGRVKHPTPAGHAVLAMGALAHPGAFPALKVLDV